MKCEMCGKENQANDNYCGYCGSNLNENSNKKIFKKINVFRIISSILYISLLGFLFYLYVKTMTFNANAAVVIAFFLEPFILAAIAYSSVIIFYNLIYFNKNIISNIKTVSIMEFKPCIFTLIYLLILLNEQNSYLKIILTLLITIVLLISPISKLILLKKVSNYNLEEKIQKKNQKYKKNFIITSICVLIVLYFISLSKSSDFCEQNYDLDKNQLNKELKSYTFIDENTYTTGAQGLNCRTKFKETYISFKDKYNNEVRLTIDDSDMGKINNDSHVFEVAKVQFVNNILKGEKLKIVYYEHEKEYQIQINEPNLISYFDVYINLNYKKPSSVHLYEFDLNNIPYKVKITIEQKDETTIDKDFIMPYIEEVVHNIYDNVGEDNIESFIIEFNREEDIKISNYTKNKITWE